ncbi:uncharacterized protein LOC128092981 isoform X1 [Culex pipiens pallens]|uniref:uncharacterized protein LOC128092981 isoform X1 n=1 Tax=Culex pipiens pallens TaxID=42434 RepID=UPI0022AA9FC9|nr:uncharacterized protein LOC128092981 isoform X1 [Culex pipiens pallens]
MSNLDFSQKCLTKVLLNFPASSFRYIPRLPPPPPGVRRTTTKLSALSSTRSGGVDGFSFPLSTADEIECLEAAVRQSQRIWEQYVQFLRNQKTTAMDIAGVMKLLFQDEALDGYNFNGIQGRQRQKRPLRMYAIFVDCMLVVWPELGMDQLCAVVDDAVRRTKYRYKKSIYRAKKALEEWNNTLMNMAQSDLPPTQFS